jgi:hypothetical protein
LENADAIKAARSKRVTDWRQLKWLAAQSINVFNNGANIKN